MAGTPFPVDGILYDADGTTARASTLVVLTNVTINEEQTYTTNSDGEFMFDLANFTGYSHNDECTLYSSYGNKYDEEYFTVNTTEGAKTQNLTLDHTITPSAVYASITDIRDFTKVKTGEFTNSAIYNMLKRATSLIDERTARTWKGVQTETDEYFDGDDTDILWLSHPNIQSITSVAIDDNDDGTYTALTVADDIHLYKEGYIMVDDDADINKFTAGPKTVKVTYTYGIARPTETVRWLCIMIVSNWMHNEPVRQEQADKILQELKWKGPIGLS